MNRTLFLALLLALLLLLVLTVLPLSVLFFMVERAEDVRTFFLTEELALVALDLPVALLLVDPLLVELPDELLIRVVRPEPPLAL